MNKIGENQCRDILDSFAWDSTGYKESAGIRAREREDSHIFYFRDWFNIVTGNGLREGRIMKIYQNTFGSRTVREEDGAVSLCADPFDRQTYYMLCRCNYGIKKFLAECYVSGILSPGEYFDIQKYKQVRLKSEKEIVEFFDKYEDVDRVLVPKDLVIYKKDRYGQLVPEGVVKEKQLKDKPVKRQTYLGEEYARESLYETIEDCLADGDELIIAEGKSIEAQIVIDYVKYLELEGQIINLLQQGAVLDKEADAVNQKIISLIQELDGLKNQYTALQNQRKDLQSQQNKLQEFQNQLLR